VSMPDRKTTLFLSHAWEDKESFVEPLYQALKDEFDVWYDKARIKLGDSIYEKISEGIRECDFGVVVFSPHFLKKNWTQEELNGLKAQQTAIRKVILPIRHHLEIEELKAKWPMEAGKYSISSAEGVPAVLEAIRAAVGVDRQNKDFAKDALNEAFGDFQSAQVLAKFNYEFSRNQESVAKARETAVALLRRVKERVEELSQGSFFMTATLKFRGERGSQGCDSTTLRAGQYYKTIQYINPADNAATRYHAPG